MILIMIILLHNEYKIINLWYPTYVYQFFNFPYNYKNRLLACFQTRPRESFELTYQNCSIQIAVIIGSKIVRLITSLYKAQVSMKMLRHDCDTLKYK